MTTLLTFNGTAWIKHPRVIATKEEQDILISKDSTKEQKDAIRNKISIANEVDPILAEEATSIYNANKPEGEFLLNGCRIEFDGANYTGGIVYTKNKQVSKVEFSNQ